MNRQAKAACVSLLLHALLVCGAVVTLKQHSQLIQPPVLLDFSILASTGPAEAVAKMESASPPPPMVEKKVPPKPALRKKSPPPQTVIRKSLPSAAKETPSVETVPVTTGADAPASPDSAPVSSDPPASAQRSGASQTRGNSSGIFSIGQLDGPLTALARTPPAYPPAAKRQNIEGWIKVKFVVDEHGQVGQISVLAAEPKGIFEQSVLQCVSHWRFKPGTVNGMAVKALVEQTVTFKLEG
ncbi:MAG: TonB family protein [Desulfobulbus sp.]|nr:TonB family protein [Desulfobulbus sp.]